MVEQQDPEVWDILEEVIREPSGAAQPRADAAPSRHPGLRAGARRGQGHPASTRWSAPRFNADFDGDQMAVHVPLIARRRRSRPSSLMLSTNNIFVAGARRADHHAVAGHRAGLLLPDPEPVRPRRSRRKRPARADASTSSRQRC
jgi:hypothetical protein